MSFILDALRKSEHERQRQTGPALAEVAVASVKPRTNTWATAAIVLLVVNLLAVGTLLISRSRQDSPQLPVARPPETEPDAVMPEASRQEPVTQSVPEAAPPPMLQPAREPAAVAGGSRNPLADEVSGGPPMLDPQLTADASAVPDGPPAVTVAPSRGGSVIYESLPDAGALGGGGPTVDATPPAPRNLPTADDLVASGGIPALNLQLHVYSTRPQERFVFINGHKYREGDALQEGPVVDAITTEGVVLEFRGNRFLLPRD
jgi:general secretion pathway protein B